MRKRFIKLLLFKVDKQYRLLYGFSSETEQSSYLWKAFPADKKGQKLIVKAILSPSEADNFLISLTGTEPIMLCERVTLKSPQLYKREQLLYSDDEERQTVPISEFCYLSEFWNREKLSLLSEIQNEFNADGRKLYEHTGGFSNRPFLVFSAVFCSKAAAMGFSADASAGALAGPLPMGAVAGWDVAVTAGVISGITGAGDGGMLCTAAGGANGSPCGAALLSPKIALMSNPSSSGIS